MLRKVVLFCLVLACLWLLPSVSILGYSSNKPEVKGARTTIMNFERTAEAPDPNEIFALVNQARAEAGLTPLAAEGRLAELATERANDMAKNQYYSHRNTAGQYYYDILRSRGLSTAYSCENLDMEFSLAPLPYVTAWLGSSAGHRECLLNDRVTSAGYATVTLPQKNPSDTRTYIVVAIHSTEINQQ